MPSLRERIRGLSLSAIDLASLTNWPTPVIEDYLSIFDSLLLFVEHLELTTQLNVEIVTADYTVKRSDGLVLLRANSAPITCKLPFLPLEGQRHSIKCIDNTFACVIDPQGNNIDASTDLFPIYKDESITVKADSDKDWWIE
jgi:hypothetical protein